MRQTAPLRLAGESDKALPTKLHFTKARLAAVRCPAGKDRVYVFDTQTPSLAFCRTSAGGAAFYLYKRVKGRPVRYKLADGGIAVDDARAMCIGKLTRINDGEDIQMQRIADRRQMTTKQLFEHWMQVEGTKKRSAEQYRSNFELHATRLLNRKIDSVTRHDVAKLHAELGKDKPYQANRVLAVLSIIFRWATAHYGIDNPVQGVKRFPETSRERFLQPDELSRFYSAIESEPDPAWKDYFTLLIATGQRRSNVGGMSWADVDLINKVWRIPAHSAKGKRMISVPLGDDAVTVLQARQRDRETSQWVFPSHSLCGHLTEPKAAWERLLTRAGITGLRIHDIRRTVGSYMAISGVSDRLIGGALGQSTAQATNVYARLRAEPVRAAMLTGLQAMQTMRAAAETVAKDQEKQRRPKKRKAPTGRV